MMLLANKYDPSIVPLMNARYYTAQQQAGVGTLMVFSGVVGQQFNFTTYIEPFNGMLYYLWATNNNNDENAPGQWIRYSVINPETMSIVHTGTVIPQDPLVAHTACALWACDGELYAITRAGNNPTLYRFISIESGWEQVGPFMSGYLISEPPIKYGDKWALALRNSGGTYIAIGDLENGWDISLVPETTGIDAIEPSLIEHRGDLNLLLRNNAGSYLYRHYGGKTELTNYPDARSKTHRVRLPDGRVVIVGNAIPYQTQSNRSILHMGIGADGLRADVIKIVKKDPPPMKFGGFTNRLGWNYPNCCVYGGKLFIASSLNKEDAVLDFFDISAI